MYLPELKRSCLTVKSGRNLRLVLLAVVLMLGLSGCSGYSHIPLASKQSTDDKTGTVQATLQWNPVPGATSYNVYWSKFPGVTRHNSYKIPDAANPIVITDLEPATTYYFVVTVVGESGESRESKEMSFAGMGAAGVIDFEDLVAQAAPISAPPAVKPEKSPPDQPTPVVTHQKKKPATQTSTASRNIGRYSGTSQATLAWDNVPEAISYNIYWRNQPRVTKQNAKKIENVNNPHTLKNLAPGQTYYIVVTAVSKDSESSISEEIAYTVK